MKMGNISINDDLMKSFIFYGAILALKCLMMSFATARQRFRKGVFAAEEDIVKKPDKLKVKYDDPDVERVRRSHQNDIENVYPFFLLAPLYLTTNPAYNVAINLFRAFTIARFFHSFVYLFKVPQPSRALSFMIGMAINVYMGVMIIKSQL